MISGGANFKSLDSAYRSFTDYEGTSAPSLPDYEAYTTGTYSSQSTGVFGGSPKGHDCPGGMAPGYFGSTHNLFDQLAGAGYVWKTYEEMLTGNTSGWVCTTPSNNGYLTRHCPASFFSTTRTQLGSAHGQGRYDFPELAYDIANSSLPDFFMITPNSLHDGHDSGISAPNTWLTSGGSWGTGLTGIINAMRAGGLLHVVFDNVPNPDTISPITGTGIVYSVICGPGVTHTTDSTYYTHFSMTKGIQAMFGVAPWTSGVDSHYTSAATINLGSGSTDTTPPSTATLALGTPTASSIPLTMTATDDVAVAGFDVYQVLHGGSFAGTPTYPSVASNYVVTGLAASTQYDFKAKAVDTSGNKSVAFSTLQTATTAAATDTTPPSTATLSLGTPTSSTIPLTMTATDNVAVSGFDVYQALHGGAFAQIATNVTSVYTASGLTASTQYDFRVKAVDTSGNRSVSFSTVQTATTTSGGDTTPPSTATLALGTITDTGMVATMTATDNVAVAGFDVYQALHGGTFSQIATNVASPYTVSGLTASTQYDFRAKAVDTSGNRSTAFSVTQTATTTSGVDVTPPTAPTALTATLNGNTEIDLAWTAATDNVAVTGYQVWRDAGTGPILTQTLGTVTTLADPGLVANTHYSYYLKAVDAAGNVSAQSNTAAATTPPGSGTDAVNDTYARNVTNDWGTATDGHVWVRDQGTNTQLQVVSGTGGTISLVSGNAPIIAIHTVNQSDYDATMTYKFSALPTGGKQDITLGLRYKDAANYTRVRVDQVVGGHAVIGIDRQIANVNTNLNPGGTDFDTGAAQAINTLYKLRFRAVGTSVKAKLWLASQAEPSTWTVQGTDNVAAVISGGVCVRSQAVSYTGGSHYTVTSFVGTPTSIPPPVAPSGGVPSLNDDTPVVGQVLSCLPGTWAGTTPITFAYLWQVSATGTGGWTTATGSGSATATYTVASGDATEFLRCQVTASNIAGSSAATPTEVSAAVAAAPATPVNTVAPAVTPTTGLVVGTVLSVTNGTWTNTPTSYQYKWIRVDPATGTTAVIAAATASSYTATSADSGFELRAQVQATNGAGSSSYVASNTTATVNIVVNNGTVTDDSGNGMTGTLVAGSSGLFPTGVAGVSGLFGSRGIRFDGTGGRVEIPDPTGILNSAHWTLGGWIRLPASPQNSDPAGWRYEMAEKAGVKWINVVYATTNPPAPHPAATKYVVRIGGFFGTPGVFDNLDSVHPLVPGTAAHIAGTYDGVNMRIYINAVLDSSKARAGDTAPNNEALVIGAKHQTLGGEIIEAFMPNGAVIEGFFAADRALSVSELASVKSSTFPIWADVGQSYTPVTGDVGMRLRARQTATNRAGTAGDVGVPSLPITSVTNPSGPVNTVRATLDDTAYQEGDTVSYVQGTWTGTPTPTITDTIQTSASPSGPWANATGPNQPFLIPTDGSLVGMYLRVRESATNTVGTVTATSPAVGPITAIGPQSPPVDIAPPTLTPNTVTAGVVITATPGTWTGDTGTPVYTWWERSGSGATPVIVQGPDTNLTYTPSDTDVQLQVVETRNNVNGSTDAASVWISPPAPPVITPLYPIPNQQLSQERIVSLWSLQGQIPPGEAFYVRVDGGAWQQAIQSGSVLTCPIDLGADGEHTIDGDVF